MQKFLWWSGNGPMFFKRAFILRFCTGKLFSSESIKHFILCYLFWLIDWLKTVPALKGPKPALDFGKAGLEGLPRPGNTGPRLSLPYWPGRHWTDQVFWQARQHCRTNTTHTSLTHSVYSQPPGAIGSKCRSSVLSFAADSDCIPIVGAVLSLKF